MSSASNPTATARAKFPIRTKLLLLMSAMVLGAILSYLLLAIKLFKEDKTVLVYELNAGNVRTLSAELQAELLKIIDKVKLLTSGHQSGEWVRAVLESEPDLITYSLFRPGRGGRWSRHASIVRTEALSAYGVDSAGLDELRKELPVPAERALSEEAVAVRSVLPGKAPVLTIALGLRLGALRAPAVAVVDLRIEKLVARLRENRVATVYVVNRDGEILAHPDAEVLSSRPESVSSPIVKAALASKFGLELKRFEQGGKAYLGAYADVGVGALKVISQTPEEEAFRAANRLMSKSLLFGFLIVTTALFLSGRLARSLTGPLSDLVEATGRVTRWDFSRPISARTNDEVSQLAAAFNSMSVSLKEQREQIDRHAAELEQKVRERTAELETQKKKAAEASEALVRTTRLASLGELAGIAAHEVLNPVNNMNIRVEKMRNHLTQRESPDYKLASDILVAWGKAYKEGGWDALRKALDEKNDKGKALLEEDLENLLAILRDMLSRAQAREGDLGFLSSEITRVTRIINNMRGLARVQGERRPLDIKDAIEDTLAAFSDRLEREKISFSADFGPEPTGDARFAPIGPRHVLADKDELVQVFSNLLGNAIQAVVDARPDGQPREIVISVTVTGERVEIRLRDNGTGIKNANLEEIFEPHFTTKSAAEGTGLGLSISRRLVRAFDGDIGVEMTQSGVGTVFLVWLPRFNG